MSVPRKVHIRISNKKRGRGGDYWTRMRIDYELFTPDSEDSRMKIGEKPWALIEGYNVKACAKLKDIRTGEKSGILLRFKSRNETVYVRCKLQGQQRKNLREIETEMRKVDLSFQICSNGWSWNLILAQIVKKNEDIPTINFTQAIGPVLLCSSHGEVEIILVGKTNEDIGTYTRVSTGEAVSPMEASAFYTAPESDEFSSCPEIKIKASKEEKKICKHASELIA